MHEGAVIESRADQLFESLHRPGRLLGKEPERELAQVGIDDRHFLPNLFFPGRDGVPEGRETNTGDSEQRGPRQPICHCYTSGAGLERSGLWRRARLPWITVSG